MSDKRNLYLEAAISIGEDLLKSQPDTHGSTWKTMSFSEGKMQWREQESLYSGTAGIAYFLLRLYSITREQKYLDTVIRSAEGLEQHCNNTPTDYYSFYTGRMGVMYFFLQLFQVTNNQHYADVAIKIASSCEKFLRANHHISDLINGHAGTLLGLLHLHASTKQEQLLPLIDNFTNRLINTINVGNKGFYWDRSDKNIKALCGFSHGASGIGFVFLELGKYFNNATFFYIAEQAFLYEDDLYDPAYHNWPDFRKGYFTNEALQQHKKAYLEGDLKFFNQPGDMSAWCHGAPGIGLARLRAWELHQKPEHKNALEKALEKTRQTTINNTQYENATYTLCHGKGGNALLFTETLKQVNTPSLQSWVEIVANEALHFYNQNGYYNSGYPQAARQQDHSLFMGTAGVGYFYLHAAGKITQSSILNPHVQGSYRCTEGILGIDYEALTNRVAKKQFPKTFTFIGSELSAYLKKTEKKDRIDAVVTGCVENINHKDASTCYALEKLKFDMDLQVSSYVYDHIRNIVEVEKNHRLLKEDVEKWLAKKLVLQPNLYKKTSGTAEVVDNGDFVLLTPTYNGVKEIEINNFVALVLHQFTTPCSASEALQNIVDEIEISGDEEMEKVRMATMEQVELALLKGILIQHQAQ
jgi:hypothetical protein